MSGFETYEDALRLVEELVEATETISRHDRDMARQLRRCSLSVASNLAEGRHRRGGHRRERFEAAYGSAQEVKSIVECAVRVGYLPAGPMRRVWKRADSLCARTYRMLHPARVA